jgi:hypothetical protein
MPHSRCVVCLLIALVAATAISRIVYAADVDLHVAVDPRVELMSIIFRLAGNPEYNQGKLTAYLQDIDQQFGPLRDHAAIKSAQRLREKYGVSYDAVMSLAVHVTDAFELQERVPFDAADISLEKRWTPVEAREFLRELRDFVQQSDFRSFIVQHQPLYATTSLRLQKMLDEHADMKWFEQFFGARPAATFNVIPGLVNGGQCYGPSVRLADGREELFAILGVWETDDAGQPQFDEKILPTFVHEFCHSFVNHVVNSHAEELKGAGEIMYPLVKTQMQRQAYGDWRTMFNESVVRAAVIRYIMQHDPGSAPNYVAVEQMHGFAWMPELVKLFDQYEADRKTYPDLQSFMPRIVAFFNELAPHFEADVRKAQQERAERTPHIVSVSPPVDSADVDPKLEFIIITFDKPMQTRSYSVMLGPKGRDELPRVLQSIFDATGYVFRMQVRLEPNHHYEFSLNADDGGAFKSIDGVPLDKTVIRFDTGPAR